MNFLIDLNLSVKLSNSAHRFRRYGVFKAQHFCRFSDRFVLGLRKGPLASGVFSVLFLEQKLAIFQTRSNFVFHFFPNKLVASLHFSICQKISNKKEMSFSDQLNLIYTNAMYLKGNIDKL